MGKKYTEFVVSPSYKKLAKYLPSGAQDYRDYVSITCPYCKETFREIALEHLDTRRASECGKHVQGCQAARDAGAQLPSKRQRGQSKDAPSSSATAETAPAAVAGTPVTGDTHSIVQVLREQMEQQKQHHQEQLQQQERHHQEQMDRERSRGDSWKRVAKRPFGKDDAPSSPSSNEDEDCRAAKVTTLVRERELRSKTEVMEQVAGVVDAPVRDMMEAPSAYAARVVRRVHSVAKDRDTQRVRADDAVRNARVVGKELKKEKAANASLSDELHALRNASQPAACKTSDKDLNRFKHKILGIVHPDKAANAFTSVEHMATVVSQKINDM